MTTTAPAPSTLSLSDFVAACEAGENPVILLEGRRAIPDAWAVKAERVAALLARRLPRAIFRTGNAPGSDVAFARGVASVDANRLQYVVPYSGWRGNSMQAGGRVLEFDRLSEARVDDARDLAIAVSAGHQRLFKNYRQVGRSLTAGWESKPQAAARLLLRDVVKVTGCPEEGFAPAAVGLFYVDPAKPYDGGTGHTIRACERCQVPVHSQKVWGRWLEQAGDAEH